jgi:glutaredoxin 3
MIEGQWGLSFMPDLPTCRELSSKTNIAKSRCSTVNWRLTTVEKKMAIEVYTRNPCSFCVSAKSLLTTRGLTFEEIRVTEDVREQLIERVQAATRSEAEPEGRMPKTVPQIFIEGQYIGGFDDLSAYFKRLDLEADDGA